MVTGFARLQHFGGYWDGRFAGNMRALRFLRSFWLQAERLAIAVLSVFFQAPSVFDSLSDIDSDGRQKPA
jgi:hypothetical protein